MQRYHCNTCGKSFQSNRRKKRKEKKILDWYVWERQTYTNLAKRLDIGYKTIQRFLLEIDVKSVVKIDKRNVVLVVDTTFFSRTDGLCVFREPNLKMNLWWKFTPHETLHVYQSGKQHLEKNGFHIHGVVIDGKRGVRQLFEPIPVQMCHFHQKQIIKRYITDRPRLEASKELKLIVATLTKTDEQTLTHELEQWYTKWEVFLKERTTDIETGRWHFTHKRLRSAYRSLKTNLPYLFTYQRYPELHIPNTTNSLDGWFNRLKSLLHVHRGLSKIRRNKVIKIIIKGQN